MIWLIVLELTGFLQCAHLGYLIQDPEVGNFRSCYSQEELFSMSATSRYSAQDQVQPLKKNVSQKEKVTFKKLIRMWWKEDFYLTEAQFLVGSRERLKRQEQLYEALAENRIIEKYYQPLIVDSPLRWSSVEIEKIRSSLAPRKLSYKGFTSTLNDHLWTFVSAGQLWASFIILAALMMILSRKVTLLDIELEQH